MKKYFTLFILLVVGSYGHSQSSEKYNVDSGFFNVSFGSKNILNYIGNVFTSTSSSTQLFDWENADSLISIKYFKTKNTAIRLKFNVKFKSNKTDEIVQAFDNELNLIPDKVVRNIFIDESFSMGFGLGREKNFGYKNWRYYHGFEGYFNFRSNRSRIINGNPLPLYLGAKLDEKSGVDLRLSARLLGGFEYMFLPHLSLGIELGWGVIISKYADGEFIIVEQNIDGDVVEVLKQGDKKSSSFSLDNSPIPSFKANIYFPLN